MNLQGGENNNNQPPTTANAAAAVDRPLNTAAKPTNVGVPSNTLDELEGVVGAAKLEAAAQPTVPVQAPAESPAESPKGQFEKQFGSGSAEPVADDATPGLIDTALANLGTAPPAKENSINNNQPLAETPQQPEQTPVSKLKQQISDAVEKFLNAEREKAASS